MNILPIGILDSGIGGLTVAKEIVRLLPNENIIYLGDTARVPYGSRGREVICSFAKDLVSFLLDKKVKCIIVACNTISATCLTDLQSLVPVPLLGVIDPSVEAIVKTTKNKRVGVIGTKATINSNKYTDAINDLDSTIAVITKACPMFVPLAEEGLAESDAALLLARGYLSELKGIDTLHLGCTHYPLLRRTIQKVIGDDVTIIDSAIPAAYALHDLLSEKLLINKSVEEPERKFYVTDLSATVYDIATNFFGFDITPYISEVGI